MKQTAGTAKKSVAKIGKAVPKMATPGTSGSAAATPKVSMKNFNAMKKFLKARK